MGLLKVLESLLLLCAKCKLKSECCEKHEQTPDKVLKRSSCFKFKYNADSSDSGSEAQSPEPSS